MTDKKHYTRSMTDDMEIQSERDHFIESKPAGYKRTASATTDSKMRVIGVRIDGEVQWHAINPGPNDHDTLCGLTADDPAIGHEGIVSAGRGQKIKCETCYEIVRSIKEAKFRDSDFDEVVHHG